MLFVRFYAQIQSKKLKAYTLVKNKTILYNILPLIRININIKMAFLCSFLALRALCLFSVSSMQKTLRICRRAFFPLFVCFYIYLRAAPRASHAATASSSGASLQITKSAAIIAPAASASSFQFLIHSPSPQP